MKKIGIWKQEQTLLHMSGKSGVITNCLSTFPAIQPSL